MNDIRRKQRQRVKRAQKGEPRFRARRRVLLSLIAIAFTSLVWRSVDRQIFETEFLQDQGERRHLRVVEISAHRGMISDRRGEVLAISTPVDSVWANPQRVSPDRRVLAPLARTLEMDQDKLRRILAQRGDREFVYLKRRANPETAEKVQALGINGVGLQREYRRFYPSAEVTAHVIGFTDIDDRGQEGLELGYDSWLRGEPGLKRVIKDGREHVVREVESIQTPQAGKDLVLSIDRRLQFLAYRELKAAVRKHKAKSGSVVILDVSTGEVLAMVNQPSYNPNGRRDGRRGRLRNRVVTDVFEPGSTAKPFTVATAIERRLFNPGSPIDTSPGFMRVGRDQIRDMRNYGLLDVSGVLQKSSNVGASKIALALEAEDLWQALVRFGFGEVTESSFPGESAGQLPHFSHWSRFEQAVLSFGYGLSVTPLQLAQSYAVLAADGVRRPVSLLRVDAPPKGVRMLRSSTAYAVRSMLKAVVSEEGTAPLARIPGYQVAGKTGTAKKSVAGGYAKDRYLAVFAGMAPASDPRLVMVVVIDEPNAGEYYGGQVAAPVFSKVMAGALRLLNVPPDGLSVDQPRLAEAGGRL